MDALRREPLLPLTAKQRGMIGEARVSAALEAQLVGRGLSTVPLASQAGKKMSFFPSSVHADTGIGA